jgi:O-acetyl-ADP-ribose deacetylase (regulator of RNase III)
MLKQTHGNLIDLAEQGQFDIIVQGCNCFSTMGSGLAREIRERYPQAYQADCQFESSSEIDRLGNYSCVEVTHSGPKGDVTFTVVNAYTQFGFNRMGETNDVFEYDSFSVILGKLARKYGTLRFGLPRIGQGLAGGDPQLINSMIDQFAQTVAQRGGSVTVVDFA